MKADVGMASKADLQRVEIGTLQRFCEDVVRCAGADEATTTAATRAMMHGSVHGVDSHGVRLLEHYVRVLECGRVNGNPRMHFSQAVAAGATLNADHAHGALATYTAMEKATELATQFGLGAVAIQNSSHFGPAGAYVLEPAAKGLVGMVLCNSDSFVRLHGGAASFHGTNPIAVAVPSGEANPWLLDMATSAIPYNRMLLHRSLGTNLPNGVASAEDGRDTTDAERATMLAPLGADYGYKGAGLAGLVEIFSAVLTGMTLSSDILPMDGQDVSTPRKLGAFALTIDPRAFAGRQAFADGMRRYLNALRRSPTAPGQKVLAPGDREWTEAERRRSIGIPIDPATAQSFSELADRFNLPQPLFDQASEDHQS